MDRYLLLFSIGPVQSFIAQARKTQDLYGGSFLLSYLSQIVAKEIKNKGGSLIFPTKVDTSTIPTFPNLFLAEIQDKNPYLLGEQLENKIKNEWQTMAKKAINGLLEPPRGSFANNQIDTMLEIYWAFYPLNGTYNQNYDAIQRLFAARKNIRNFKPLEEIGLKCSICGERNALIYRKRENETGDRIQRLNEQKTKILELSDTEGYSISDVSPGEQICAVCLAKRRLYKNFNKADFERNFPSVAEIASRPATEALNKLDKDLVSNYKEIFGEYFDAELLYEENLTEHYFQKSGIPLESLGKAKTYYKKIKELLEASKIKLSSYYGILALDGDRMGKWLSGDFLDEANKLKEFHQKSSEKLIEFAKKARDIIENQGKGKVVYAGGDDVLAFIPLKNLFETLRMLRDEFPKFEGLGFNTREKSSVSCGVVVAHYKLPLRMVLQQVREIEKEAKEKWQRDAFSIALMKHSGEIKIGGAKWQYGDFKTIVKLRSISERFKPMPDKVWFSDTFIYNLKREFQKFVDKEGLFQSFAPIFEAELKRLLIRASNGPEQENGKKKKEIAEHYSKIISAIFNKMHLRLKDLLALLEIAVFISKEF